MRADACWNDEDEVASRADACAEEPLDPVSKSPPVTEADAAEERPQPPKLSRGHQPSHASRPADHRRAPPACHKKLGRKRHRPGR